MPRRKSAEEEIDDLVDDLDELEEDEDVEVEDEVEEIEDEDPDEAPKKRRRTRKTTTKPKAEKTGVGTTEVAEAAGTEPRQLRMYLRAQGIQPRDDREGRYNWPSLNDPEVKKIVKAIRDGAVEKMNKEKLDSLKGKSSAKKTTASKKRAASK